MLFLFICCSIYRYGCLNEDEENDDNEEEVTDNELNQNDNQQQQIQPLMCVTHPSSLHSYFNLCYPQPQNLPVYYINHHHHHQTEINDKTPTLVAFGAPPPPQPLPTTSTSNTNITATLTPIMSVLPPMEINQFCIATSSSDNANSYLIYEQQPYHKPINVISTLNNNNRINPSSESILILFNNSSNWFF